MREPEHQFVEMDVEKLAADYAPRRFAMPGFRGRTASLSSPRRASRPCITR